jgi:hypothetical protein
MRSIPQVSEVMTTLLQKRAKERERPTGFVQRSHVRIDGPTFATALVLGWMHWPDASYSQLRHSIASLGVHVSKQAVEQRFGEGSSRLMQALFEEALGTVVEATVPGLELLERFNGVYLQDGSVISLPDSLADRWPGSGAEGGAAAVRLNTRIEWSRGHLQGPFLQPARDDERSAPGLPPLPTGALWNVDMAYFTLPQMRQLAGQGQYWLTHAKAHLKFYDGGGLCWDLASFLKQQEGEVVDVAVQVGVRDRLPARLIAVRLSQQQAQRRRERANKQVLMPPKGVQAPLVGKRAAPGKRTSKQKHKRVSPARLRLADWIVLLTNVPPALLSAQEAVALVRCRWQIELIFKLWKQVGRLDTWRSGKAERILTELYAKLLGLLFTQWETVLGCWQAPNRSVRLARQVVEWMSPVLAVAFSGLLPVEAVIGRTVQMMQRGCTIDTRSRDPNTCQLLQQAGMRRGFG